MNNFLSLYTPNFATAVVYMLQSTEYQVGPYLKWFWQTKDFNKIMYRRTLVKTRPARLLLLAMRLGLVVQYTVTLILAVIFFHHDTPVWAIISLLLSLITPLIWAHLIILPLYLGRLLLVKPRQRLTIAKSGQAFADHQAIKIAVAGSYGKTTMKEMLLTVLSEGKKVSATPANKNVSISHALFAKGLSGDEDVLVIEYGEGAPGDVAKFSRTTKPNMAVITGLAPAHLDKYKSLGQAGKDIFSLADYLDNKQVYVNAESDAAKGFIKPSHLAYTFSGVAGWKISSIKQSINGISFMMKKGKVVLSLKSSLLGRHQVGPLAAVAAISYELGLTKAQIETGVSKIASFEHRMQPYKLADAWIIDDTYNGNIEGMKAGLELLKVLPGQRKIYITPGLVDQGAESARIHEQLGEMIASAKPDIVVLMNHSVTPDILKGISNIGLKGQLVIEEDPLNFYTHLDMFIAAGDLLVMQNDWPDNYS